MYSDIPKPNIQKAKSLFEYAVKKAIQKNELSSYYMHNQWANILFAFEPNRSLRIDFMSKIKHKYSIYFTPEFRYTFDVDKLKEHFPKLFGIEEDKYDDPLVQLFMDVQRALALEVKEQKNPHNMQIYRVSKVLNIKKYDDQFIYRATLIIEEGEDPHFSEGVPFFYKSDGTKYPCEAVEFDYTSGVLYFTCRKRNLIGYGSTVILDSAFLIQGLKDRLIEISRSEIDMDTPLMKILDNASDEIEDVKHKPVTEKYYKGLDNSQTEAFQAAINKDITFIWGPPGTGKSFTLAKIIYALYDLGEDRTAVCCLSNVAVDQLVNKVVDLIQADKRKIEPGNFYRAGRTLDTRIVNTDFLFPNDATTNELRRQIKKIKERLDELKTKGRKTSEEVIELKARNKDLRDRLKEATDHLVAESRVIFSTITNFVLSSSIKNSHFDNLIVDEASMLSMPNLIALASQITKRIILVGDFMQLSPIAIVQDDLLQDNVFDMAGIDINNVRHPALHLLLNQRRSHKMIVDILNSTIYRNKLHAEITSESPIAEIPPFPDKIVAFRNVEGAEVNMTRGGTRQNSKNADAVMEILEEYAKGRTSDFSIGIITPYKGQVALLYWKLNNEHNFTEQFKERLKIGTVHTFQGSESDVIIFDFVECGEFKEGHGKGNGIGKIFNEEEGLHLLNVAVSRARSKLIVVGDRQFMSNIKDQKLSYESQALLLKLIVPKKINRR